MNEFLQPSRFVDSDHPRVIEFTRKHALGADDREKAVALYVAVRDGVRYNPFQNFTLDDAYRGSTCLERGEGWCVPKAALLGYGIQDLGFVGQTFDTLREHMREIDHERVAERP